MTQRATPLAARLVVRLGLLIFGVALAAGRPVSASITPDSLAGVFPVVADKGAVTRYDPSDDAFPNPERGFSADSISYSADPERRWPLSMEFLEEARSRNITVVRRIYSLAKFRTSPIDDDYLELIRNDLQTARTAGLKLIPRFVYNFNEPDGSREDAPLATIMMHIDQLEPIWQQNYDVIAHLQAGFIGAWGEWHSSTNGLRDDVTSMRQVLRALLAALPTSRMVALRYPYDKRAIYETDKPLPAAKAFNGSDRARTGHHNDCFLADVDDWGTYWPLDPASLEWQKDYLDQENRYVVQDGEACNYNPPRTDCPTALAELERMHWRTINGEWETQTLQGWRDQGCWSEIERRLGYRFQLSKSIIPPRAHAGGPFRMSFEITNQGWGALYNPRLARIVLRHQQTHAIHVIELPDDPRFWQSGTTTRVKVNATLPANLAAGTYDVLLHLVDPAPQVTNRPEYAIRLANDDVWEPATGYNSFLRSIQIR